MFHGGSSLVLVLGILSTLARQAVPFCRYCCSFRQHRIHIRSSHQSSSSSSSSSSEGDERREEQQEDSSLHGATTTIQAGPVSITESEFPGAGLPRPDLPPDDIPTLLMTALRHNDFPLVDSGLTSVWAFSGDTTRHIFQHNFTDFVQTAHETAREFNTSFYAVAMNGQSWEMETPLNRVGGSRSSSSDDDDDDNDEKCWIATQVMKTISSDGRLRRWQWELRKNRRPPNLGCWYVESIGSSDRKGQFEPE